MFSVADSEKSPLWKIRDICSPLKSLKMKFLEKANTDLNTLNLAIWKSQDLHLSIGIGIAKIFFLAYNFFRKTKI